MVLYRLFQKVSSSLENNQAIIKQNISFYNEIAKQYDDILEQDKDNIFVRQKVSVVFSSIMKSGLVLDFGGGTGKDIDWLVKKGYSVIFCEPSVNMRKKAILFSKKNLPGSDIIFLNNTESDFINWPVSIPFSKKVDGVLANFAVINNIPDIKLLFKNLSLVINQGGHLLMLVLKPSLRKSWQSNRLATLRSIFTDETVTTTIKFDRQDQKVFFYTVKKIKKTASPYFHFQSNCLLNEDSFELIHLTRK